MQRIIPAVCVKGGGYLFERAHIVVFRKGILLQKLLLDDLGDIQSQLLILGQRVPAHQLHNFGQLHLLMQDLLDPLPQVRELLIELVEVRVQLPLVV